MKRTPLKRKTRLGPGKKALENLAKFGTALAPRSKSPIRRAELNADAEWRAAIRAIWGDYCLLRLPGCTGMAGEIAHGYAKGPHPEFRTAIWNGFSVCSKCHRTSPVSAHRDGRVAAALREMADECLAAYAGKRPQPMEDELQSILVRHMA